jgi:large subunit ribosomal protein L21
VYAVLRIGGFQCIAREGDTLTLPRLEAEPGAEVKLDQVLFVRDGDRAVVGRPTVPGSYVAAQVVEHDRARKVTTFKFRRREKYRRRIGHRQDQTRVRITGIHAGEEPA